MHLSVFIFSFALLITLISLLKPLAEKVNFPYTVMLAVIGILLGLVIMFSSGHSETNIGSQIINSFSSVSLTSKAIIFIFLPALIFESALSIEVSTLMKNIRPIMILAVIGLLISTVIIGYSLAFVSALSVVACLLIGAIASATDPVAVVAIFKSIGAPTRLNVLVEGESLLNDGTAIVLFTILSGILIDGEAMGIWSGIGFFLKTFFGGLVVGFVIAYFFIWIMSYLIKHYTVIMTLLITLPYVTFTVAEHFCHVSGVLAVIANALVINSYGRSSILPKTMHDAHAVWEEIAFWANSLIFIFMNLLMPSLLANSDGSMIWSMVVLIVSAFVARAVIIYLLLPFMSRFKLCDTISNSYKAVMFWGALRGSVSLALVLSLLENQALDKQVSQYITVVTVVFVLFTLFVNATTIQALLEWLGIKKLSEKNQLLRSNRLEYIKRQTLESIQSSNVVRLYCAEIIETIHHDYALQLKHVASKTALDKNQVKKVILYSLIYREQKYYENLFDEGYISSEMAEFFRVYLKDCQERVEVEGVEGYPDGIKELFKPTFLFIVALYLQRSCNISHYVQLALTKRFKCAFFFKSATQHMKEYNREELLSLGEPHEINQFLDWVFDLRQAASDRIHRDLVLQYPEFTSQLEGRFYHIYILRTELKYLNSLSRHGVVNTLIYDAMQRDIATALSQHEHLPRLDLGLEPLQMLKKVDLFADLDEAQLTLLAKKMKSYFAIPEEMICKKGDSSNSMYFISSGVLKVDLPSKPVYLSNGDFFGEIALLTGQPRTADVISETYATLIVLSKSQFQEALRDYPHIIEHITKIAEQRLDTL